MPLHHSVRALPDRLRDAFVPKKASIAVLLVAAAVGLAACGGSSGSGSSSPTTAAGAGTTSTAAGGTGTQSAAFVKYSACLKQHGVSFAGGGFGFGSRRQAGGSQPAGTTGTAPARPAVSAATRAKFTAARTACAKLLPKGGFGFRGGPGGGFGGNSAASAAFRNCLTIHGVKLARGNGGQPAAGVSAKLRKALTACASLRPKRSQASPSPTGTTSTNPAS
jgi:hypothetical protein